jgi:uncharacterized protein YjbI with pentapeptide repeats
MGGFWRKRRRRAARDVARQAKVIVLSADTGHWENQICLAAVMHRTARSPVAPELPGHLECPAITTLGHDDTFAEIELSDVALPDQHATGVAFQAARLTKVDLSGSRLEHLRITHGVLAACNLANLTASNAEISRTTLETSRLTGITLSQSTLHDVMIRDCRVDLASFGSCRLTRVTFEDCLLAQTDFLEATLESVRFHGCDLRSADFRDAHLQGCEIRRCDLTDLQGVKSLRGAALEWSTVVEMAGVWATTLGIEILDTD